MMKDKDFERLVEAECESITVGEMILEAMGKAEITKSDLARKMHTSPAAITRYTHPDYQKFRLDTLAAIAQALGGRLTVSLSLPPARGRKKATTLSAEFIAVTK